MRARTGTAHLPLHGGRAPAWLFSRLNLVAVESDPVRSASAELARGKPAVVLSALKAMPLLDMPRRHAVLVADVSPQYLQKILLKTYDRAPEDFETLLGMEGVGARTLRALALTAEIIYGTPASTRDPARFPSPTAARMAFRTRSTRARTTRPSTCCVPR